MFKISFPKTVQWCNADQDVEITLIGEYSVMNGRFYYKAESGCGIPADEVIFVGRIDKVLNWYKVQSIKQK